MGEVRQAVKAGLDTADVLARFEADAIAKDCPSRNGLPEALEERPQLAVEDFGGLEVREVAGAGEDDQPAAGNGSVQGLGLGDRREDVLDST